MQPFISSTRRMDQRQDTSILPPLPRPRQRNTIILIIFLHFFSFHSYPLRTLNNEIFLSRHRKQDSTTHSYSYNNSPYFHEKIITTSNRNPFLNESPSSSSKSTNSSVQLTQIPLPSYHDYTFNSKPISQQSTDNDLDLLQIPATPYIHNNL